MNSAIGLVVAFGLRHTLGARKLIIAALLALLPAALMVVIRWQASARDVAEFLVAGLPNLSIAVCALLSLFLGCGCARDLLEERTLPMLLTRPIPRGQLFLGLLLAAVLMSVLLAVAAPLLAMRVAGAGIDLQFTEKIPSMTSIAMAMTVLAVVHTTLFAVIGLWFSRSTVIGVAWLFVVEAGLGSIPGPARVLSPTALVETILRADFITRADIDGGAGIDYAISAGTAAVSLVIIESILLWRHHNLATRSDFLSAEAPSDSH